MQWLKKIRHLLPIFGIGATWLLFAALSEFRRPAQFVICALLSLAVFMMVRILLDCLLGKEPKPAHDTSPKADPDPLFCQGDEYLAKLQILDEQIPDGEISEHLRQMRELTGLILAVVKRQPEKKDAVRRLMEYYLPTTIGLLEKYVLLQQQGGQGENIEQAMRKIKDVVGSMVPALKKQHDDLFELDVVDITAEIRVMEKKLAAEGLSADDVLRRCWNDG